VELELFLDPAAGERPLASRLLVPATAVAGLVMVALAVLGARLVERQRALEVAAVHRRRLESLARAGAGLAHQLRTPLATVKGSCQLVLENVGHGPGAERLEAAVREAERMERTLALLLDYARPPSPEPVDVGLAEVVTELGNRHSKVTADVANDLVVRVDPAHLEQLLGNLVDNALEWSPAGGEVRISASREGDRVVVEVVDRGPGPGDDPEALFEPYVTGRADGTGLGLPMARTLAEVNGGSVTLAGAPGGGCVARLELPAGGGPR
jgi:signal transduction histidine kinase